MLLLLSYREKGEYDDCKRFINTIIDGELAHPSLLKSVTIMIYGVDELKDQYDRINEILKNKMPL